MAQRHNNIGRLVHRAAEEIRASAYIGRTAGVGEGFNAFRAKLDLQVMNRNGYFESPAVKARLMRKHEAVMTCLERLLGDFADSYDFEMGLAPVPEGMGDKIWMCWWQGLENAPAVVRACVDSVRRNAGGREVVVVTEDSLGSYVDLPGWMLEKVDAGVASRTNLSDLLRLSLLARYGGIWLDSTFYCCGALEGPIYNAPLFSIKRPDYLHGSIASGYFAGYSLGCDGENREIFAFVRDLFLEYWRRSDFLIDYLLIDYLIVLAQRHRPEIKQRFDGIMPNNPACDELYKVMGDAYDEEAWRRLSSDTDLFKLTWKRGYPEAVERNPTFFGKLIDGGLL